MNEFEELLNSVGDVKVGDVVSGEILTVEGDQATVAIVGTGVEGVLTLRELTNERDADINDFVKAGEVKELLVVKQIVGKESEGANVYLLSEKRLAARKAFADLEGKEGEVVTVKVLKDVKGGLSVDFNGVRGFIPASMIDTYFVRDTKKFVGEEFDAKIIEVNAAEKRFILSRRAVIEEESKSQRAEAFANLHEGDIVEGTVARTTDFGAGRVSLSLKATQPGPWDDIDEKAPVGSVLDGTVKRITDFGAFVEIFPGVEGLVHISQISWERVENAKDVLSVGQAVQVKVLDVKPAEERISLSIKALTEAPARKERSNDSGNAAQGGQRRDAKPRAPRRNTKPEYTLPETQEGFSLADFLGDDFDINNF